MKVAATLTVGLVTGAGAALAAQSATATDGWTWGLGQSGATTQGWTWG